MIRKIICFLSVSAVVFQLSACRLNEDKLTEKQIFAMDTVMDIKYYGGSDETAQKAENEIKRIEKMLKRSEVQSDVYNINQNTRTDVSSETAELIKTALDIGSQTNGAFDISIAPVMDLWGFYGQEFYVPTEAELKNALETVDYTKISVEGNTVLNPELKQIDLGAIAKGFTSDSLMELFKENGIESAIVSLGGNVQAIGTKPNGSSWTVAVRNPNDSSSYIGTVKITNKAVVTSGGYERCFSENGKTYHHIIDTDTGYPAENGLISATVISENGTLADALSTSVYIMGFDKSVEYWKNHNDFDLVMVKDDGTVYITDGLKDVYEGMCDFEIISR